MNILSLILTVAGLAFFEVINSIDNAIINAEVLSTMAPKAKRWFLSWGFLIAVFGVRGLLPWLIVWISSPSLGPGGALVASFSSNAQVVENIHNSSFVLLLGGGIFLVFLFLHWLFLEEKSFSFGFEKKFALMGIWFFAAVSILLTVLVLLAINRDPLLAFGAVIGSSAFFIMHGFKQAAQEQEKSLRTQAHTDISKILFLEIIDATFSVDGILGAFAFTLAVPLILVGNGIGAWVVRKLTLSNVERIKQYLFLKNGAMYSILILGSIMILDGFGVEVPSIISPISTFVIVGYFFLKSQKPLPVSI